MGLTALVVGATGAVGAALTEQLVVHPSFQKVITIGRRPVDLPPSITPQCALEQVKVDMDKMEEAAASFAGVDVVFCGLGTTRAVAGSAEQFRKVDYGYVAKSAELAKAAGVPQFSLVSAQSSDAKQWASDLRIFHAFLYMQTKGRAEDAVKAQGFSTVSIYRPGLLDRGDKGRAWEKAFLKVAPNVVKVGDLARLMITHALQATPGHQTYELKPIVAAINAPTAKAS